MSDRLDAERHALQVERATLIMTTVAQDNRLAQLYLNDPEFHAVLHTVLAHPESTVLFGVHPGLLGDLAEAAERRIADRRRRIWRAERGEPL